MPKGKVKVKANPSPEKETFKGRDVEWKQVDGKIPYLETNIDKFYHLVKQRKGINFYDAAAEHGVAKEQIASWARILEDHKLARVHYPVFGSPVIFPLEEKDEKKTGEGEEKERKHGKGAPKIAVALVGGLMVFSGYVMLVTNPFTITVRSQLTITISRFGALFGFLPYPLSIITPVIIIIAALWLVLGRLRHRSGGKAEPKKDKPKKEEKPRKESKDRPKNIEDKISKIKEELGS
jgi:hypothetical protein